MELSALVAPSTRDAIPTGHSVHPVAAGASAYDPAGHGEQSSGLDAAVLLLSVPGEKSKQRSEERYCPRLQSAHSEAAVAPMDAVVVPIRHGAQVDEPVVVA